MKRLILLLSLLLPTAGFGQTCAIDWCTIDAGVCTSTSALCSVTATIGQPDAWCSTSANCMIAGGFWGMLGPAVVQSPGAPVLAIAPAGLSTVVVSWPAPAPGWVLQESPSLVNGQWYTVIAPLAQAAGRIQALQPAGVGMKFYRLSQAAAVPALSVQATATNTLVSWTAPASGWVLETCPASGSGFWSVVSASPTLVGGQLQVSLPALAGNDFYQLVLAPILSIAPSAANAIAISWPASAGGWTLEGSATLSPANWATVTNALVQVGTNMQMTVSPLVGKGFYRPKPQ